MTVRMLSAAAAGVLVLAAAPALAQTPYSQTPYAPQQQPQDAFGAILGALFGDRFGVSTSLESEWGRGRRPLYTQRNQFEARLDADLRSGALNSRQVERMRSRYDELVDLEARYAADGRITTQERADLVERYSQFSQRLEEVASDDNDRGDRDSLADGRYAFDARVDAAVRARQLTRTEGSRLKSDYAALVQAEVGYLRDGRLTRLEREDLDRRLEDLNDRVGDGGSGAGWQDPRARLYEIDRALSSSGLSSSAQAQIRVELGDLTRLEAAYARSQPSADDRAYLERRIGELETRARVRR